MSLFITTLCLTFPIFGAAALIINFCKRRTRHTRHSLTGMCHESGGTMCGSCSSSIQKSIPPAGKE